MPAPTVQPPGALLAPTFDLPAGEMIVVPGRKRPTTRRASSWLPGLMGRCVTMRLIIRA